MRCNHPFSFVGKQRAYNNLQPPTLPQPRWREQCNTYLSTWVYVFSSRAPAPTLHSVMTSVPELFLTSTLRNHHDATQRLGRFLNYRSHRRLHMFLSYHVLHNFINKWNVSGPTEAKIRSIYHYTTLGNTGIRKTKGRFSCA
jgi:hypothetical protein